MLMMRPTTAEMAVKSQKLRQSFSMLAFLRIQLYHTGEQVAQLLRRSNHELVAWDRPDTAGRQDVHNDGAPVRKMRLAHHSHGLSIESHPTKRAHRVSSVLEFRNDGLEVAKKKRPIVGGDLRFTLPSFEDAVKTARDSRTT